MASTFAQDAEVRALMQQMNADEGLNKVQLTLYTSRWQGASLRTLAPLNPCQCPHAAPASSRRLPRLRSLAAAAPDRRYTRMHEQQELADSSACCTIS
jgi:hypothetical protein